MWADAYQPLMSRLVQDSLIKLCSENLPTPKDSCLELDAIVCITSGKGIGNQIVIKLHKVIEVTKKCHESNSNERTDSPWQIPLEKIRSVQQNRTGQDPDDGPVDLTGSNSRSILQYTSESLAPKVKRSSGDKNGAHIEPSRLSNKPESGHSELYDQLTGANTVYKGPIPIPQSQQGDNEALNSNTHTNATGGWSSGVLKNLTKLQPPNYKPLPHLKLKSPVKNNNSQDSSIIDPANNNAEVYNKNNSTNEMLCKICSHVCYGGFAALQSHTQEVHRRYLCRFCYNSFSLRCNLKRHERLHVGLKPYNCKICNKSFARSTDLKLHMQKHGMSGSDVVVPCTKCPRSFLSVQNLRWHLYKVHKETEASFACTICEKLFLDKDEYMKHREEHTNGLNSSNAMSSANYTDAQDSEFMEFGPDDSMDDGRMDGDSDNDALYIDTQSEGTGDSNSKDEECILPNLEQIHVGQETHDDNNENDLGFELVNEPVPSRELNNKTPTMNLGPDGSNISTGSRKKKKVPTATLR